MEQILYIIIGGYILSFIVPNKKKKKKIKQFIIFLIPKVAESIFNIGFRVASIFTILLGFLAGVSKIITTGNVNNGLIIFSLFLFTSVGYFHFNYKLSKL